MTRLWRHLKKGVIMSERESLFAATWRKYRTAPLDRQFQYEWYAFSVVAFLWGCFCIAWAVNWS